MKAAAVVLWLLAAVAAASPSAGLNGASGQIHLVDPAKRSFELLKETEYDPKTEIARSRFTVFWDEQSLFYQTDEVAGFDGMDGPVTALFQGIAAKDRDAIKAGLPFEARVVTLFADPAIAAGIEPDENQVLGAFTPAGAGRQGLVVVDGVPLRVSLRDKHWRIWIKRRLPHDVLAKGFWKATLQGADDGSGFVVQSMELVRLADPRETDDPALPRVLVIGDSISMNYHEAAKAALQGMANYHRCEGNAFTSAHGVRHAELWMGNMAEAGLHWDVIQFNHGLHDLKQAYDAGSDRFGPYAVSIGDYKENLEKMIAILKRSGAKLIWCSTTPVPNDNKGTYARRKGAEVEFNAAAQEVMDRHPEILVNDLHRLVSDSPVFDEWRKGVDVHFYSERERQVIGAAVAAKIREALAR